MNNSKTIRVFEFQTLRVGGDSGFTSKHFNALIKYGNKTKEKFFSIKHNGIKFNNYVGVIQVDNITIEVLPKADNLESREELKDKWHAALIDMLHECKIIKLNPVGKANLELKKTAILDLFFDMFLSETETIFKHGLRKEYHKIEENIHSLKGKIIFSQHFRRNAFHGERFYVAHDIFDPDNKLNQILLKALIILGEITANHKFTTRINHLLLNFEKISEKQITASWFDNIRYDRNTERYRQAITLAKLIILRYSPALKGGNEHVLAIMFDMNQLFEKYVYKKIRYILKNDSIPIKNIKQQSTREFWEHKRIKPDILIEGNNKTIVIDTKWKVLDRLLPSDEDLKQMFVYNLHYQSDLSILLYPKTVFSTQEKKAFRHKKYQEKHCQMAFVNLFDLNGRLNKSLGNDIYDELLKSNL